MACDIVHDNISTGSAIVAALRIFRVGYQFSLAPLVPPNKQKLLGLNEQNFPAGSNFRIGRGFSGRHWPLLLVGDSLADQKNQRTIAY